MSQEVLAELGASPPRRIFALGAVVMLGALLVYLGIDYPDASIAFRIVLVVAGGAVLWAADRQRRNTRTRLILTQDDLRDSDGTLVATVDDIEKVERGTMAFKPSNGFLILTRSAGPRHWAPGIWWRFGRRIGVGGICGAQEAKFMAERLALEVAERQNPNTDA